MNLADEIQDCVALYRMDVTKATDVPVTITILCKHARGVIATANHRVHGSSTFYTQLEIVALHNHHHAHPCNCAHDRAERLGYFND